MSAPASDPAVEIREDLPWEITQTLVRVLNSIGRNRTRRFGSETSLTMVEVELCFRIFAQENITGAELADQMGVSRSAISQVLSRLRARGYVSEHPLLGDAKRKQLRVTDAGADAVAIAARYFDMMKQELYAEPVEELQAYLRFVTKLEAFHDKFDRLQKDGG